MGKVWPVSAVWADLQAWMPGEAVGGMTGCRASDVGNAGEAPCLETVGGRLAVSLTNQFPSQESCPAVCTPGHGLSCPSRGVISPSWEAILPEASLEVGLALEASPLTCSSAAGGQGWAGGQLSQTLAHGVSGHKSQGISSGGFP